MSKLQFVNRSKRFVVTAVSLTLMLACDDSGGSLGILTSNGDVTPPVVTSTVPSSGQSGVSALANIVATFNEALDPTSVNSSTFLVTATSTGAAVAGTVSFNASSLQAIFIPTSTLLSNTNYTVTLTTGMKDASGNALASNNVFTFTTAP
jgi:hypothetical protein